jgi:transcriptional regulator GlxA family with amidase domain
VAVANEDTSLSGRADALLGRTDVLIAQSTVLLARSQYLLDDSAAKHRNLREIRSDFLRRRTTFVTGHLDTMPEIVRRVVQIITANLGQRQTLAQLGRRMGRSPWHLNVTFYRATGITVHEFTTCLRMMRAARAVRDGVKIEAIAAGLGYRSRKTFYRQFESSFRMKPAEFRTSPQRSSAPSLR